MQITGSFHMQPGEKKKVCCNYKSGFTNLKENRIFQAVQAYQIKIERSFSVGKYQNK